MSALPKIYVFARALDGIKDVQAFALAEDGTALCSHISAREELVPVDLGVDGTKPQLEERYRKHFPGGYRVEFVKLADTDAHDGLRAALHANRRAGLLAAAQQRLTEAEQNLQTSRGYTKLLEQRVAELEAGVAAVTTAIGGADG